MIMRGLWIVLLGVCLPAVSAGGAVYSAPQVPGRPTGIVAVAPPVAPGLAAGSIIDVPSLPSAALPILPALAEAPVPLPDTGPGFASIEIEEGKIESGGLMPAQIGRVRAEFKALRDFFRERRPEALSAPEGIGNASALGGLKAASIPVERGRPAVPDITPPAGLLTRLLNFVTKALFPPIMVSACLFGLGCRYDGKSLVPHPRLMRLLGSRRVVTICPEVEGGLSTPREPSKIVGGNGADVLAGRAKVMTSSGRDVTEAFLRGAHAALAKARAAGMREAFLKTRSPSCDPAYGVTAALLQREGIKVVGLDSPRQA